MLFKGRLRLPSDPGEGIPIDLELEDVFLSLDSEGEDFGEWRMDTVAVKRLFSNQFSLLLDGEEMVFVADDALGFAYDGLSTIEDVQSRLSKRRIFKARKAPKKRNVAVGDIDSPEEDEFDEFDDELVSPPTDAMPEVVPFFPESPTPSFADSVAESAVVDESIAPVAPRPIEIVEATQPSALPDAAPSFTEPDTPAAPEPEPSFTAPARGEEVPTPAILEESDDDLVIEDVAAYGYVPTVATPEAASLQEASKPDVTEPEDALEIEDVEVEQAVAVTGAILGEVHPLGEEEHTSEPGPSPEAQDLDHRGVLDDVDAQAPEAPVPVVEHEPMPDVAAADPAPLPRVPLPPVDQPSFAQWSSNGRAKAHQIEEIYETEKPEMVAAPGEDSEADGSAPQTQKPGRHTRSSGRSKSALFGRKKSREPEAHEHRYESSKTVGGITRRVCAVCGHVSFAGEDVYQDW